MSRPDAPSPRTGGRHSRPPRDQRCGPGWHRPGHCAPGAARHRSSRRERRQPRHSRTAAGLGGSSADADAGQQQPGVAQPAQHTVTPAPGQDASEDTTAAPAAPGHYEARVAGHPPESQPGPRPPKAGPAPRHTRGRTAPAPTACGKSAIVPGGPSGKPILIGRYRLGFLQLDAAARHPATQETARTRPAGRARSGPLRRPPDGTQPLAAHTGWAGNLRPERLLYADGTPLTIRGQGDDNDQVLPATAAGAVPAPADSDYGSGRLQVVRWDDGQHAIVHPALASPAGIDAYAGLSDRDRARWEAFDLAEAWPATTAGPAPAPGRRRRRPPGRAGAAQPHHGPARSPVGPARHRTLAGGLEFKVTGIRSPCSTRRTGSSRSASRKSTRRWRRRSRPPWRLPLIPRRPQIPLLTCLPARGLPTIRPRGTRHGQRPSPPRQHPLRPPAASPRPPPRPPRRPRPGHVPPG